MSNNQMIVRTDVGDERSNLDLSNPVMLKKLVSSLIYLFRFKEQAELAFLLGYPQANNNQEVLTLWITSQLKQADWVEPEQLLGYLVSKLKHKLMQWQEVA